MSTTRTAPQAIATAVSLLLTAVTAWPLLIALYLMLLTVAAAGGRRSRPPSAPEGNGPRFAVLVPAHDEALLIGRLLRNLSELDYPQDRFDVHVVADNCSDGTAALARAGGAQVHERFDRSAQSKGHALRWLLGRLQASDQQPASAGRYDAYVVLDADSVVAPNFLRSMAARLGAGSQVVQAYYSVLNASESSVAALRFAALAAVHYLRPAGRSALGLSCGLKGNGMCFAASVLEQFSWSWFTLAEDVEFHLALVRAGVRVDFAPETSVLADMPVTLAQAASQNDRWEQGRLQMLRRHVPGLLADGIRRRSFLRLDAAIEQLIPPLSVPVALAALCLAAGMVLRRPLPAVLAALGLGLQVLHLLAALAAVRAPASAYLALSYAPVYVLWKVGLYGRALLGRGQRPWVRTARAVTEPPC